MNITNLVGRLLYAYFLVVAHPASRRPMDAVFFLTIAIGKAWCTRPIKLIPQQSNPIYLHEMLRGITVNNTGRME
jgi:hypothetical protein